MPKIQLIVEGDGDMKAVPLLTRRVLQEVFQRYDIALATPQRRGELTKIKSHFSRFLKIALLEQAPVLWVVDCDDGDPSAHLEELNLLLSAEYSSQPIRFVLMVKEYESLFLAERKAAQLILKIKDSVSFPPQPESIRGTKEWLSKHMESGYAYKETLHQEKLTAQLNIDELRTYSNSYRNFEAALKDLVEVI